MQHRNTLCAALLTLSLIGCGGKTESRPPINVSGEKQAIDTRNQEWLRLIKDGKAAEVARLYTPDGAIMPPGAPKAQGPAAVEKVWSGLMAMPGFALTFKADEITVSSAGDMALDRGTYRLQMGNAAAASEEVGKYVVVWRKIDGKWKVAADIFNSDGAAAKGG